MILTTALRRRPRGRITYLQEMRKCSLESLPGLAKSILRREQIPVQKAGFWGWPRLSSLYVSLSLVLGPQAGNLTAIPTSTQGLEDPSNSNILRRSREKRSRKGRQPLRDTDHGLLESGRRQATLSDLFTHQHSRNLRPIGTLLGDAHARDRQLCVRHSLSMSDSLRPHGMQPARLLCPWDSPGKDSGVGCHALLQGILRPRDRTHVSCASFTGRWILYQ